MVPSILAPLLPGGDKRLMPLPQPDGALAKPMTFELVGGGKLMATGTITPGISASFAAEIGKRGDYIKTVVLNSPGGSVTDALAMGRLIRDKKVRNRSRGREILRIVLPVGVRRRHRAARRRQGHDRRASGGRTCVLPPAGAPRNEMSVAQNISARCQRYLGDMGINLQVWVHAMETPHDKLFVFKPDELKSLNIVTVAAAAPPVAPAPSPAPIQRRQGRVPDEASS